MFGMDILERPIRLSGALSFDIAFRSMRILSLFGSRPEAMDMAPFVLVLGDTEGIRKASSRMAALVSYPNPTMDSAE